MWSRWAIALSGMLVMTCLGSIYSWSIFTQPLAASFGWSNTAVTWAFALATLFLSIGAVVGGRWQDRAGPRFVALTGVVLWGLGCVLAGLGTSRLGVLWLYLTYGLIGGFGVGMAYVTPVVVVTKWFPDRRGLGSGLVVTGFGLGAFVYNFVVKSIPGFEAAAIAAAEYFAAPQFGAQVPTLPAHHVQAVMDVLVGSGVVFLVVGGICAAFLRNPAPGSDPSRAQAAEPVQVSHRTQEMLRTPQFYVLWSMLFLNVTAGILIISNAVPIMQELTDLPPKTVAAAFGGIALANAAGRVFWAAVSDRLGRRLVFTVIFGLQAAVFFVLDGAATLPAVMLAYAIILLCYGGGFGTMPSFNADYFGTRHMGANYGTLLTAWGIAGLVGPLFVAQFKDATGSFSGALPVVAIMLLAGMILPVIIRRPAACAGMNAKGLGARAPMAILGGPVSRLSRTTARNLSRGTKHPLSTSAGEDLASARNT